MTNGLSGDRHELLERYLDGLLSAAESRQFESMLAADAVLRRQAELQARVDAGLRAVAAAIPEPASVLAKVSTKPQPAPRRSRATRLVLTSAAIAALSLGGAWGIVSWLDLRDGAGGSTTTPYKSMRQVYTELKSAGFKVDWKCESDAEFADTFRRRLGQALLVSATLPPGVEINGLTYARVSPEESIVLVAKIDGAGVVVFIGEREHCSGGETAAGGGLYAFRREIGKLQLVEIGPLNSPRLLDLFHNPDEPRP